MKFLFVSKFGDILATAHRVKEEGNDVQVYIDNPEYRVMYEGILENVYPLQPGHVDWSDLVIFDHVGLGPTADKIAKRRPVVGGGSFHDSLELDRLFAFETMTKHGIKLPEYKSFSPDEIAPASDYAKEFGKPLVLKVIGDADVATTYVSYGPDDLIPMIHYIMSNVTQCSGFILQEYVRGVEISTEGWFAKDHWLHPFNITFEEKKLLVGDLGPNTGCAGNLVKALEQVPRLAQESLMLLTQLLTSVKYVGPLDINAIVSENGFHALEFTPRFGYDAWQCLSALLTCDIGKFLHDLTEGTIEMEVDLGLWAAGVRVTIPKDSDNKATPDVPLPGVLNEYDMNLSDVKQSGDTLVSAGSDNNILTAVATSPSWRGAIGHVYDRLERLRIPNKQYRTDVGERVEEDMEDLQHWGYTIQ